MWDKIKAWLGIAQKKADAAFDETGDVIKGYGREADALVHFRQDYRNDEAVRRARREDRRH
jgi:phage-related minor tail protein